MQKGRFLRVTDGSYEFLFPSDEAVSIERRDSLEQNTSVGGSVVAWFVSDGVNWPIMRLCQILGTAADRWNQAIFLNFGATTVGIAAESVQLASESHTTQIKPFTMIGAVDPNGSLYTGVCLQDGEAILVLDAQGIAKQVSRHLGLA